MKQRFHTVAAYTRSYLSCSTVTRTAATFLNLAISESDTYCLVEK